MSRKICVLESHQTISDKPARSVSKAIAAYLVRKALARHVSRQIIQMVELKDSLPIIEANIKIRPIVWDIPRLKAPRMPENLLLSYPIKDERTCYGAY